MRQSISIEKAFNGYIVSFEGRQCREHAVFENKNMAIEFVAKKVDEPAVEPKQTGSFARAESIG